MSLRTFALGAALALMTANASAATLDFTELGTGIIGTPNASVTGADLAGSSTGLFVGAGGIANSICSLDIGLFSCANDLQLDFTSAVNNLLFDVGGFQVGDFIEVSVFGLGGLLSGTIDITGGGLLDLSAFGVVTALFFDDASTANGVSYGNFSFDVVDGVVPLPASLPLLAAALGTFAVFRRRKSA